MQQEPHNQNLHPENPPVLEGREARQGKVYERRSRTRFLMLAGLIALVAALAALIYFGGGGG
ncbi:hypothetical protein [Iodidimonas sp. SYSU 1G8]|uniref:hypothetical protein n=1 Tax=Iodidimonas sp. SYSU 1G8 TaxID=3133967 RepID=UPI0031FE9B53